MEHWPATTVFMFIVALIFALPAPAWKQNSGSQARVAIVRQAGCAYDTQRVMVLQVTSGSIAGGRSGWRIMNLTMTGKKGLKI